MGNIENYMWVDPQETFVPNCRVIAEDQAINDHCVLQWNLVGTVVLRRNIDFTAIDVEFADRTFHRNFNLNDDFKAEFACMNYSGLLLASKGEKQDYDQYEDDDEELSQKIVDKKSSYIFFRSFRQQYQPSIKDWHFKLEASESIECIAQGTGWCAAYTDAGFLRVFSQDGIQRYIMHQASMVVTMAGYENMLMVVYHGGLPVHDHQHLMFKIIDCGGQAFNKQSLFKTKFEGQFPISREARVLWAGFSEEGMPMSYDDNGVLSGFNFQNKTWMPLLDLKCEFPSTYKNFWIVGIAENELLAIEMPKNSEAGPSLKLRSFYKRIKLHIPLIKSPNEEAQKDEKTTDQLEEQYLRQQMITTHETFRRQEWESLKNFRSTNDPERFLSDNILEQKDIVNHKKELDKLTIQQIRQCIIQSNHEKVFGYLDLLNFANSLKLIVKLCNQMQQVELAQKVSQFIKDKEHRDVLMQGQNASELKQAYDSRQVSMCMKPQASEEQTTSQTEPQPAPTKLEVSQTPSLVESQPRNIQNDKIVAPKPRAQNPFAKKEVEANEGMKQTGGDVFTEMKSLKRKNPFAQDGLNGPPVVKTTK